MNVLSLCSGIGALDLGIRLAVPTAETVCYVERKPHAIDVLLARIDDGWLDLAPIVTDLLEFDGGSWRGRVDCVAAGFPCQPHSTAARGRIVAEDLWPEILRVCEECQPRFVFLENVQAAPIQRALTDLSRCGWRCAAGSLTAAALGAPHERKRWWLLADSHHQEQPAQPLHARTVASLRTPQHPDWWKAMPHRILGMDVRTAHRMDRLNLTAECVLPVVAAHAWLQLSRRLAA